MGEVFTAACGLLQPALLINSSKQVKILVDRRGISNVHGA
jgi:hypothetical protein